MRTTAAIAYAMIVAIVAGSLTMPGCCECRWRYGADADFLKVPRYGTDATARQFPKTRTIVALHEDLMQTMFGADWQTQEIFISAPRPWEWEPLAKGTHQLVLGGYDRDMTVLYSLTTGKAMRLEFDVKSRTVKVERAVAFSGHHIVRPDGTLHFEAPLRKV